METIEFKNVKRDGFEEVDRILIIVESSKKEFEQAKDVLLRNAIIMWLIVSTGSVVIFYLVSNFKNLLLISAQGFMPAFSINQLNQYLLSFFLLFITGFLIGIFFGSYRIYSSKKKNYRMTILQAADVIREIIPILSRSEHWSALRNFELRLRLSKLGISSEKLFAQGDF